MRQIKEIIKVVSSNTYLGKDDLERVSEINTDRVLRKGQSVLLKNGVVVGIVETKSVRVYDV